MARLCDLVLFWMLEGADDKARRRIERELDTAARTGMKIRVRATELALVAGVARRVPDWYQGEAAASAAGLAALGAVAGFAG